MEEKELTYLSGMIAPTIIMIIVLAGLIEKKNVYDLFCEGAKDGIKITLKMFPTLIGIFLAISMLRNSGFLLFLSKVFIKITQSLNIPSEIIPLALIRPISGSASIALGTDLMTKFGPDSKIGLISAVIMGSSETTFYVIAVYMNSVNAKNGRNVIIPGIIADMVSLITALILMS